MPVAAVKNIGITAIEVFDEGAMYSKCAHLSGQPSHIVRQIGNVDVSARYEYKINTVP